MGHLITFKMKPFDVQLKHLRLSRRCEKHLHILNRTQRPNCEHAIIVHYFFQGLRISLFHLDNH